MATVTKMSLPVIFVISTYTSMNTYQHNSIIIFVFFFTDTHIAPTSASFFAHCLTIRFLELYDLMASCVWYTPCMTTLKY